MAGVDRPTEIVHYYNQPMLSVLVGNAQILLQGFDSVYIGLR